ncbi:MAG: FtsX-like permease family protein [Steroidobacteraceae bacterium]|jgi:putative ABC transport system permease protein|nr:FtsX-like permease family protein [Steroidobacteraceae bacterium]
MGALHRKLLRDFWRLRGQVFAIALVMASGVGVLVMALTAVESLEQTAIAYYERYGFADVFARVERAPENVAVKLREIPGVRTVETRVVRTAVLDVAGFPEPVIGELVSVPERAEAHLNRLALREGRLPRDGRPDEAVLAEPFAQAHALAPGDHLRAVINGRWRELTVVGVALSPEYVYAIGPGALMPDDRRFGVLWLGREALEAAFDLDGAFNDVSLAILPGADPEAVVGHVDRILAPYGGVGAYARADQLSNWFLMNEIDQSRTLSTILPTIFLAVAAFLTHMVLGRLVAVERSEIGLLKAFGYTNRDIAAHYARFALGIGLVGVLLGWCVGYWLGRYDTQLYAELYHFPFLLFRPGPQAFAIAAAVSLGAALLGALAAVRTAAVLPPAEAMRPPAPPPFQRTAFGDLGLVRRLDQPTRILLRQVVRWPGRSFVTTAGIAMSIAVLVTAMQWLDAIEHMIDVYFLQAQGQDVSVGFAQPRSAEIERDLRRLPGVRTTEPMRAVPARLRHGWRMQREAVQGLPARQQLYRVYDAEGRALELPPDGLVISTMLAKLLDVRVGDRITVEVLEGRRPVAEVPVVATFETYIGSPAYMDLRALARLMRERPSVTAVHLRVDAAHRGPLFRALKALPSVSSVTVREAAVRTFRDTMAETITIFVSFFVVFACALAFGVTYNAARVALSERGRELATLRVLGFTRAEISYLLLGELALLAFVALPLGCAAGFGLASLIVQAFETELYRVPLVVLPETYGLAMAIGLVATAVSALLVRRRLDRLDLIAVLKTRE